MSTKFSMSQLVSFAQKAGVIDGQTGQMILRYAGVDAEKLADPMQLRQALYWQDQAERLAQHPTIQDAIIPAGPPTARQAQQAIVINRSTGQASLVPVNQPVQPARRMPVQRSNAPQYYVQVEPTYAPAPVQATKSAVTITPPQITGQPVQKSHAAPRLYRKVGVNFSGPQPRPIMKAVTEYEPARPGEQIYEKTGANTYRLIQRSAAQELPISPFTGAPSAITALCRRSVGLDAPDVAHQHPYMVEQQRQQQAVMQRAQYESSLPISPFTGKPSSITAMVRDSVGLR